MFFKNVIAYRFDPELTVRVPCVRNQIPSQLEVDLGKKSLEELMPNQASVPCGSFDKRTIGWVQHASGDFARELVPGAFLLQFGVEEKILPPAVVKDELAKLTAAKAEEQGYPCGKRQIREIKEAVSTQLLAKALSRRRTTRAILNVVQGWLFVEASSLARAEDVTSLLRETLGSFPARHIETKHTPSDAFPTWLLGQPSGNFTVETDLELAAMTKDRAKIKYSGGELVLDSPELRANLQRMAVVRLGLSWRDRLAFVADNQLRLKKLQWLGVESKPAEDATQEEIEAASLALQSGELVAVFEDLIDAMGGEVRPKN